MWRAFITTLILTMMIIVPTFASGGANTSRVQMDLNEVEKQNSLFFKHIKDVTFELSKAKSKKDRVDHIKRFEEAYLAFRKFKYAIPLEQEVDPSKNETAQEVGKRNIQTIESVTKFRKMITSFDKVYDVFKRSVIDPYIIASNQGANKIEPTQFQQDVCDRFTTEIHFNFGVKHQELELPYPEQTVFAWCAEIMNSI